MSVWGQDAANLNFFDFLRPSQILGYNFKYAVPVILYAGAAIYLIKNIFKKTICWRDYGILCLSIYGLLMYKAALRAVHGPQFQMALQPAIILGFVFLEDIFENILKLNQEVFTKKRLVKFVSLAVIFVLMLTYAIVSQKRFYGSLKGWFHYQKYKRYVTPTYVGAIPFYKLNLSALIIARAKGVIVPLRQAKEIEGVTRYITSVTSPGEIVFTFPEHGIYNFFADRPCLDRFNTAVGAFIKPEYRKELLTDLKKVRPRYIIYGRNLSNIAMAINRSEELLPEIIEYINSNYEKEAAFGAIDILRRINH